MQLDLLSNQRIDILLPDGSILCLSHGSQRTRVEHWIDHQLDTLLTLPFQCSESTISLQRNLAT